MNWQEDQREKSITRVMSRTKRIIYVKAANKLVLMKVPVSTLASFTKVWADC